MKKIQLEKNCLDLAYQRNLQYLNALLSLGAGSVVAFLGGLILNFEKWFLYSGVLVLIFTIIIFIFKRTDSNLKDISNQIKNL